MMGCLRLALVSLGIGLFFVDLASASEAHTLVVLLTGNGNSAAIRSRAMEFATDLGHSFDFHVVGANATGHWRAADAQNWATQAPEVALHVVNKEHLEDPWRTTYVKRYETNAQFGGVSPGLAALSWSKEYMQTRPDLQFVWLLEDDVVIDGSWDAFFTHYASDPAYASVDLITSYNADSRTDEPASKWLQTCELYRAGNKYVSESGQPPWPERFYSVMFIARWSRRLVDAVAHGMSPDAAGRERLPACHLEMLVPWACMFRHRDWCTRESVSPTHISGLFTATKNASLKTAKALRGQAKVKRLQHMIRCGLARKTAGRHPIQLYHPVKATTVLHDSCSGAIPTDDRTGAGS